MMTSSASAKLPAYRRLKHEDEDGVDGNYDYVKERELVRSTRSLSWCKFRSFRKAHIRRRSFKLKVPNLRRLLFLRRKVKLISAALRVSCSKVLKRFKEGQAHFSDLFAGNYLFLHINPSSLKCLHSKPTTTSTHHLQFINGFSKAYTLPSTSSNNVA